MTQLQTFYTDNQKKLVALQQRCLSRCDDNFIRAKGSSESGSLDSAEASVILQECREACFVRSLENLAKIERQADAHFTRYFTASVTD